MDQPETSAPSYQLPVTEKKPAGKKWIIAVVAAVIIVLLIAAAVAASIYVPFANSFASALFLPSELKAATFFSDDMQGTTAFHQQGFSYVPTAVEGTLVSATEAQHAEVVRTGTQTFSVRIAGKEVFATTTPVVGIAAAADGSALAVAIPRTAPAVRAETMAPGSLLSIITIDSTAWHLLVIRKMETTTMRITGPEGVSPLFLQSDTLLYISAAGINTWNMLTNRVTPLLAGNFRTAPISVLQSPDHTLVGFRDMEKKVITIYRVSPSKLEVVAALPITTLSVSYTLGNDALYAVRHSSFGSQVWKQGFAEKDMHWIAFLPKSLMISRMSIGSL